MAAMFVGGMELGLARFLYWLMPLCCVLGVTAAVRRHRARRPRRGDPWRRHAAGWGLALGVTAAALWASPPRMRMQFDETSLCGTAQGMHQRRAALMGLAALPAGDGPRIVAWQLDKRPPLFPFLVSVLHDLTGYRVANAFVVNGACFLLLLGWLASVARNWLGPGGALAVPLLLGALPLLVVAGTSAGFELLAVALLAVFVVAAIEYVAEPSSSGLSWLLASGLLYSLSRYESAIVFALVMILCRWRTGPFRLDRLGIALVAVAPLVFAALGMLWWHARDPAFYPEAGGRDLVSWHYAAEHAGPLALAFFEPLLWNAFPGVLGVLAVGAWAVWVAKGRATLADALAVAPVLALTAIALLWFYGDVAEPTAPRLYLPPAVLGVLGGILLPAMSRSRPLAIGLAVFALACAVPRWLAVHRGDLAPEHSTAVLLEEIEAKVLANVPHDPDRSLWVTPVAQYLVVGGHAAITPARFDEYEADLGDAEVFVLLSPLDERLRPLGDPRDVLRGHPHELLGRAEDGHGAVMAVYRLR